jgi:hypothetical protein
MDELIKWQRWLAAYRLGVRDHKVQRPALQMLLS